MTKLFNNFYTSGFGYLGHTSRTPLTDKVIQTVANYWNLSPEDLNQILDSSFGRYLLDDFGDNLELLEKKFSIRARWFLNVLKREV